MHGLGKATASSTQYHREQLSLLATSRLGPWNSSNLESDVIYKPLHIRRSWQCNLGIEMHKVEPSAPLKTTTSTPASRLFLAQQACFCSFGTTMNGQQVYHVTTCQSLNIRKLSKPPHVQLPFFHLPVYLWWYERDCISLPEGLDQQGLHVISMVCEVRPAPPYVQRPLLVPLSHGAGNSILACKAFP